MAERKSKRQRFSLGGPAVDTSFEDYLTGSNKHVSSDEEEDFDQENLDPNDRLEEDLEKYFGDESDPEPIRQESKRYLINKIHIHQNNTESKTAKDVYYLLHGRLILPNTPVAITRLLRVPAILLFHQLSEALYAAFDWGGDYSKYTLEQNPQNGSGNEFPDADREIAHIRDLDPSSRRRPFKNPCTDFSTALDSRKVRLMDIWNQTQIPEVKALKMFFTYDCDGENPWYAAITFMGLADKSLQAADLGIDVDEGQQIWCVGGSGAVIGEYKPAEEIDEGTHRHEWDIDFHNGELAEVKVRDVSYYTQ
ncbi:hypothetical protein E4T52_11231 [Aureobasidium sp. EXF-3400]|nr:hypothetical protein E4T51_10124 [Aureobasidium sp. EXF-12344]KAI4773794.1 hypothetical protein E4T52_11231 [Aureobasidium sp. EXF-3400]